MSFCQTIFGLIFMQTRHRNTFTSIHTEGSLLPVDLLERALAESK